MPPLSDGGEEKRAANPHRREKPGRETTLLGGREYGKVGAGGRRRWAGKGGGGLVEDSVSRHPEQTDRHIEGIFDDTLLLSGAHALLHSPTAAPSLPPRIGRGVCGSRCCTVKRHATTR